MERLEQILKWSWLAVPFMFAGWTLIAVEAVGLLVLSGILHVYADRMSYVDMRKYPVTHWTSLFFFVPALFAQLGIWLTWGKPEYEPLFYPFLSEFTILHWTGIL